MRQARMEDIENTLKKQDLADVIAYLRGGL